MENGQWKMENPLPIRGTIAECGKWRFRDVKFCGNSEVWFLEKRGSLLRSERASRGYGKSPLTVASSSHVIFCRNPTRVRHSRTRKKSSKFSDFLKSSRPPLVYVRNDAARCSSRSKPQAKWLLHPYETAKRLGF